MNYKRNVFGSLAAAILIVAATAPAAAQLSNTDSETVTLVLPETLCTVNIRHEDGDFGAWEWVTGTGWMRTSPDSEMELWVMLPADTYNGCDLRVTFGGLSDGDKRIAATNFSATFGSAPQEPADFTVQGLKMVDYNLYYTLDSIPDDLPPGIYKGEIAVSVTNAA